MIGLDEMNFEVPFLLPTFPFYSSISELTRKVLNYGQGGSLPTTPVLPLSPPPAPKAGGSFKHMWIDKASA